MVVKKLWDYIKLNDLQNPDNRREILCDDKLRALFNADKVHMFTMNKVEDPKIDLTVGIIKPYVGESRCCRRG